MSKEQKKEPSVESEKKRQVKVVYYDDNSTVADMSGTRKDAHRPPRKKSTFKEKCHTYFSVMKKMVIPMLCTLAAFTLIYLILLWIAS